MVIYDKNQFTFNIVFVFILIASLFLNVYYATNFKIVNERLTEIEDNQNFNFIQSSHNTLEFDLTEHGFLIRSVDEFGILTGPSMQPAIFDQNTIIEKTYNQEPLLEGQIVRFTRADKQAVIHRVRADYGDKVYVQGDSLKEGEIINKNQITHIVIGVIFT